ncbi:cytochrome P450 [Microbacterium hominis]|uniref:cytochrome P450 n=1 Tax=Microbacterium hominis TaxID=162426 RepID=UPI00168ABA92|nr:cytochrome P450 [Microbacterium hominis]QOC25160.1 cytochrome P450 [Microbacterium hominis]QOC29195.1 cytochrome P450 [Microbacterium hominis]
MQTSQKPDSENPGALVNLRHDDSIWLLLRGYGFGEMLWHRISDGARSVRFGLLGRTALLLRGSEAVEVFYDEQRVVRHGAMPAFVQETLFGHGSVHSLDGEEHRHRKATFVETAYDDAQVQRLLPFLEKAWAEELDAWLAGGKRSAYDAAVSAFGRAVMRWAGLPGTAAAHTRWAARLAQIVDGFGVPYSPEFALAVLNRRWSDRHATRLIEAVRAGKLHAPDDTALNAWAHHRDRRGELLAPHLAGVELQNSIRPMVAVARFVAFAAKELHDRPAWRARIAAETIERGSLTGNLLATMFAQEIRRTAPFVPLLPGWATTDLEVEGRHIPAGGRVVLDILGTNTDARSWERPDEFDPERFRGVADYEAIRTFIPHGGADVATGHRCPGEKLAIAGLSVAISVLSDPRLKILDSGLGVNRRRLPTKPSSGGRVRSTGSASCPFHAK